MITVQGRQHRTYKQPRWYALQLQLNYKAISEHGPVYGFGQTRMMSGRDIIFAPDDGLEPGMTAQILVDWPRLLDGRIHLRLVLEATITRSRDGVAEAHILAYDFHTCRLAEEVNKHLMGCNRCDDLLAAYKNSVGHYTKFLESVGGALGSDSRLASIKAEELALGCREASDALMAHWRQDHSNLCL